MTSSDITPAQNAWGPMTPSYPADELLFATTQVKCAK